MVFEYCLMTLILLFPKHVALTKLFRIFEMNLNQHQSRSLSSKHLIRISCSDQLIRARTDQRGQQFRMSKNSDPERQTGSCQKDLGNRLYTNRQSNELECWKQISIKKLHTGPQFWIHLRFAQSRICFRFFYSE